MAKPELPQNLKRLSEILGNSHPMMPGNEIVPQFLAELKLEEVGELFSQVFSLFRETVDREHEVALRKHHFVQNVYLDKEARQLSEIAEALASWMEGNGIEFILAVRAQAVESLMNRHQTSRKNIDRYSSSNSHYRRFHIGSLPHDTAEGHTALRLGFSADTNGVLLYTWSTGAIANFDIRDVYLTNICYP